jgi:hypothetical protein
MLLVIGVLEAVGPYSHGGYGVIDDRFFSDPIQPGGKILLATGPYGHVQCCINPLDEPHDPKAAFHVEFVQFVDGSTFGDLARAKDVFVSRTSTLLMLRNLDQTYSDQGEQKFRTRLLQAQSPALFEVLEPIRETAKEEATRAAIAELRKILSLGKKHEAMIGGRLPN